MAETKVTVKIGNRNFVASLKEAIADELVVAQKKWGIRLNSEQEANISSLALVQLQEKVKSLFGSNWLVSEDLIIIFRKSPKSGSMELAKRSSRFQGEWTNRDRYWFNRTTTSVFLSEEPEGDDPLFYAPLKEGYKFFETMLMKWVRTAVFYGVASYGQA